MFGQPGPGPDVSVRGYAPPEHYRVAAALAIAGLGLTAAMAAAVLGEVNAAARAAPGGSPNCKTGSQAGENRPIRMATFHAGRTQRRVAVAVPFGLSVLLQISGLLYALIHRDSPGRPPRRSLTHLPPEGEAALLDPGSQANQDPRGPEGPKTFGTPIVNWHAARVRLGSARGPERPSNVSSGMMLPRMPDRSKGMRHADRPP